MCAWNKTRQKSGASHTRTRPDTNRAGQADGRLSFRHTKVSGQGKRGRKRNSFLPSLSVFPYFSFYFDAIVAGGTKKPRWSFLSWPITLWRAFFFDPFLYPQKFYGKECCDQRYSVVFVGTKSYLVVEILYYRWAAFSKAPRRGIKNYIKKKTR